MTRGGKADEEERINRNLDREITSRFWAVRARIAWCMVGTAVYHVGGNSSIHSKNLGA